MSKLLTPTFKQESKFFILCQNFTAMYISIHLARLDERTGAIFMLVGEDIGVVLERNGEWRFTV
jgi:hypothetical protein